MDRDTKRRELDKTLKERQQAFDAWDAEVVKFQNWPPVVDEAALDRMDGLKAIFDEKHRAWRGVLAEPVDD